MVEGKYVVMKVSKTRFSQMVTVRSCLVPVTTDVESFGTACRLSLFSFQKNGNIPSLTLC